MADNARETGRRRPRTRHGDRRGTRSVTQTVRPPMAAAAGPSSSTATTTVPQGATPTEGSNESQQAVLRLRLTRRPRVRWTKDTHDNEHDGKKSSKSCCIYHKNRSWDESSTESGEDPSDDDDDKGYERDQGNSSSRDRHRNGGGHHDASDRGPTARNGRGGASTDRRRDGNTCETQVESDGSSSSGGPVPRAHKQARNQG